MIRTALLTAILVSSTAAIANPLTARQIERRDGMVRFAADVVSPAVRGAPEDVARTFLLTHRAELGLEGQELELGRVLKTKLGAVVRFHTTVAGLPVYGVQVSVALDHENRIRRVMSDASPIHGVSSNARITAQQALDRAGEGIPLVRYDGAGNVRGEYRQVMWLEHGVARLAWEVHLDTFDITRNLYVVVDAKTGEIKYRANRVFHAAADMAKVYATNPGRDGTNSLIEVELTGLAEPRDPNGYLVGELFDSFNCCTSEGCDPTKGPKRVNVNFLGFAINSVICDMQHTASNVADRATGAPRTNYDYANASPTQFDPPTAEPGSDPADSDTFSEVHVHYHATKAYEFFRTHGDPSFVLRDGRRSPPRKPQVWANFLMPDFSSMGFGGINGFSRMDNAMFMPREGWQQIGLPGSVAPDSDALVMFQGEMADFGYDGDVVYHEFTHGVIYSTAGFEYLQVDAHGALNEGGAMHEGFADYFAAAITNDPKVGDYVGPRVPVSEVAPPAEGSLRDLENDFKCPDLLVGEVHVDSEHFSAALWASRKRVGGDAPNTFDAAVFDALVSLSPRASFKDAAEAVAGSAAAAFPGVANARELVLEEFRKRGVIECEKSLPYTGPRRFYVIEGTARGLAPFVPGPIQFRITLPRGATELHVTAENQAGMPFFGGGAPEVQLLANVGKPVTFDTRNRTALKHDAAYQVQTTFSNGRLAAKLPIEAACGDEVHATLVNLGQGTATLTNVTFGVTAGDTVCEEPDAGTGSDPEPDAGTEPTDEPGEESPIIEESGCGCSSTATSPVLLAGLLAMLGLLRRRVR